MGEYLTCKSEITAEESFADLMTAAVRKAIQNLERDMGAVLKYTEEAGISIRLKRAELKPGCYCLALVGRTLLLEASDELGAIYGIYGISKELLGIHEFWFWNDQRLEQQDRIPIPEGYYRESQPFAVRYRGWFVNDEVLISAWSIDRVKEKPWEMVFEALLRCGGNIVIPGTDRNGARYRKMASDMGLYITHHHAEPLGAEMFARAYPHLNPSYAEHPELFHGLWEEGIQKQKGMHVIWNLGFRGQGDCPFWNSDPQYVTDEARGRLISDLIRMQYGMVKKADPAAVCCTNLYGETMELYQKGFMDLPEDVIMIWADNGYGRMVSRRQGNHNPRVPALPENQDNRHGIYYHVSFYDLQAANHITMLTNPGELIKNELTQVLEKGARDFWIINCSNVKPHVYYLDAIAQMWKRGKLDIREHKVGYIGCYYSREHSNLIAGFFDEYEKCALRYGPNEDDHAGEQFPNHGTRILATQWIVDINKHAEEFLWANSESTLKGQIAWYTSKCRQAAMDYGRFVDHCQAIAPVLEINERRIFEDTLELHGEIYAYCYKGATLFGESFLQFCEGNLKRAFYEAGKAADAYRAADQVMHKREHGKWNGFYGNECLTDIKQTVWVLQGLMSWIRTLDDGPHYFRWQREFLYSEEDRRVMLILNMENHLTDQEIFSLMKEKWDI